MHGKDGRTDGWGATLNAASREDALITEVVKRVRYMFHRKPHRLRISSRLYFGNSIPYCPRGILNVTVSQCKRGGFVK